MSFNPSKYRISETADFEVPDAKGNPILLDDGVDEKGQPKYKPWTITLASPGTKEAMRAAHEMQQAAKGDLFSQMSGKQSKRDEMDEVKDLAKFLMAITKGTNADGIEYDGKTGLEALRAMYLDPYMGHVAAFLKKSHDDRGNFYAG